MTVSDTVKICFRQSLNIHNILTLIITLLSDKTKNNTYWKRFNGPDNFTVLWNPFDTSNSGFKLWRVRIIWNRNVNLHIVGS